MITYMGKSNVKTKIFRTDSGMTPSFYRDDFIQLLGECIAKEEMVSGWSETINILNIVLNTPDNEMVVFYTVEVKS